MCFPYDAIPPELPARRRPPVAGGAGGERLELTAADGARFSASLALAPEPRGPGVVILPDVRGLFPFYETLAERFADAGHPAIAIDYFGRTAGTGPRDEGFDHMAHVQQVTADQVTQDTAAAVARLRAEDGDAVVTVGFCFGGGQSWLQAAAGHGLAGAAGFYGAPVSRREGMPSPVDRVEAFECPVLGLFGGDDEHITPEHIQRFDAALADAGVEHELVAYPGTPHSFFDRRQEQCAEASADAWERLLGFLGAVSGSRA